MFFFFLNLFVAWFVYVQLSHSQRSLPLFRGITTITIGPCQGLPNLYYVLQCHHGLYIFVYGFHSRLRLEEHVFTRFVTSTEFVRLGFIFFGLWVHVTLRFRFADIGFLYTHC